MLVSNSVSPRLRVKISSQAKSRVDDAGLFLAVAAVGLALVDLLVSWRAYRAEKARCRREQQDALEQDARRD
mgnify:CR=1 FL=1